MHTQTATRLFSVLVTFKDGTKATCGVRCGNGAEAKKAARAHMRSEVQAHGSITKVELF